MIALAIYGAYVAGCIFLAAAGCSLLIGVGLRNAS